jgi:hypothetical protein
MGRRSTIVLLVLAVPLLTATATVLSVAADERLGGSPLSDGGPRNSAEAAALGNAVAMLRFMRFGENPALEYPVRPHIISAEVVRATTLEAAMWARRVEMIRLLDREGAIIGSDQRHELACLAADLRLPDIVEYLAGGRHDYCMPGAAMARVAARSRPGAGDRP